MNYLRLAIAILLTAFAQCSYADSIPTFYVTQATMLMAPNDGSGDNISFTFTGPGVTITGIAGMGCFSWCSGMPISSTSLAFPSEIFLSGVNTLILGGVAYDPNSINFSGTVGFFDGFGGLNSSTSAFVGPGVTPTQVNITFPTNGGWSFNFAPTTDQNGNPAFSFTNGTFSTGAPVPTPEPGTIGLMLTGLASIGGIINRRGRFRL